MGWNLHQTDVKTIFLNGVIENEVYMKQPEGFIVHEKESHIGRLKKILYELKQVSKTLCSRVYGYLTSLRFTKKDPNLHFMMVGDDPAVLVLYVDDLFLTGSKKLIVRCKRELASNQGEGSRTSTEIEKYIPQSEEVHSGDVAEIRYDRLQIDDDHYRGEPEEAASDSELVDPTMYR
jgi:hypothetical protein